MNFWVADFSQLPQVGYVIVSLGGALHSKVESCNLMLMEERNPIPNHLGFVGAYK